MCNLDPYNKGYVERRSLRRSNVIHAFHAVDMEEDINLVRACARCRGVTFP
jgi:hypothetical protein